MQQRVAIKLIDKVRDNMNGLYPAVTRILLPVVDSYDYANKKPTTAYSLLSRAFYAELMRFPELHDKDAKKASDYLPGNVHYDPETATLVQLYRGGEERSTSLLAIAIEPVSFEADAVRRKPAK